MTPASAIARARALLRIERNLGKVSDSLFDTIVANEIGPATSLATKMLGDYRLATDAVHAAFEKARSEFSNYDGSENPRSWVLGFVAEEAITRSAHLEGHEIAKDCDKLDQQDTEAALHCLAPERRLAVVLTDVIGLTEEAAARVSRVDLNTIRQRASSARTWIAEHLRPATARRASIDGATG